MLDKQKATTNQLMDSHDTGAIDFCTVDKLTTEMSNVFRYYALIWILLALLLPLVSMSRNVDGVKTTYVRNFSLRHLLQPLLNFGTDFK